MPMAAVAATATAAVAVNDAADSFDKRGLCKRHKLVNRIRQNNKNQKYISNTTTTTVATIRRTTNGTPCVAH